MRPLENLGKDQDVKDDQQRTQLFFFRPVWHFEKAEVTQYMEMVLA